MDAAPGRPGSSASSRPPPPARSSPASPITAPPVRQGGEKEEAKGDGDEPPRIPPRPKPVQWLTHEQYARLKDDPLEMVRRATSHMSALSGQIHVLTTTNRNLDEIKTSLLHNPVRPEAKENLQQHLMQMQRDHGKLTAKHEDIRMVTETLQGVVSTLRKDKSRLLESVAELRKEVRAQKHDHSRLYMRGSEWKGTQRRKEGVFQGQLEEIDSRIKQCNELSQRVLQLTEYTSQLSKELDLLENEQIPLETRNATLRQSCALQEQTKAYLHTEIEDRELELKERTADLLDLKKDLSATILELQQRNVRLEEEIEHTNSTLKRDQEMVEMQNQWLAEELKQRTTELLSEREAKAQEEADHMRTRALLQERTQRMHNNVEVLNQKKVLLLVDLGRVQNQEALNREEMQRRKANTFQAIEEQSKRIARLKTELQSAKEDLMLLNSKLCNRCHQTLRIASLSYHQPIEPQD